MARQGGRLRTAVRPTSPSTSVGAPQRATVIGTWPPTDQMVRQGTLSRQPTSTGRRFRDLRSANALLRCPPQPWLPAWLPRCRWAYVMFQ